MIKCNGKDVIPRLNGKELSRVMYNGKQIYPINNNVIEIQKADVVAGDVCVYDGTNKRFFRFVDEEATDNIKKYTPIGIVVVPTSHGHYGDDKCAIMSLNYMDLITPTTGGNPKYNTWGISVSIEGLSYFNVIPYIGGLGIVGDTILGTNSYGVCPSDKNTFTAVDNPYDIKTKYYNSNSNYYIPSPYNNDGTFNSNYSFTNSPSSTANALADFDGYNNTKKILAARGERDYSSWKPITDEDYIPVSCCDMYSTPGISQGNWYLPSAGELGYILARAQVMDNSLNKLIQIGVDMAKTVLTLLWSSTIIDNTFVWISTSYGNIQGDKKNNISCVTKAFAIV